MVGKNIAQYSLAGILSSYHFSYFNEESDFFLGRNQTPVAEMRIVFGIFHNIQTRNLMIA